MISYQAQQRSVCENDYECFKNCEQQSKNTQGITNATWNDSSQEYSKQDIQMKGWCASCLNVALWEDVKMI